MKTGPVSEQPRGSGPGLDWSAWWAGPAEAGLITDFDGTLSAIVDDPARAVPLPGVKPVLGELAHRLAVVAVVSGRPLGYLSRQLAGVPGLVLFGLYGMERSVDGRLELAPEALPWQEVAAACTARAVAQAPAGVEVEAKGLTLVLHVRGRPELYGWALEWASSAAAATGLVAQPGRLSVELVPPVGADKGNVVEELAAPLEAVCFFGDDTGDLPAFAALGRARRRGKVTLAVGAASPEQPADLAGAADVMVDGPAGALAALRQLADGFRCPPGPSVAVMG